MRIVKSALKATPLGVFAAASLCAAVLSGCTTKASADAVAEPQAAKVEQGDPQVTKVNQTDSGLPGEFTTEGKPTKTIETPWGPREIYDPARDPAIRKLAYEIFKNGSFTFGDISQFSGISRNTKASNATVGILREARHVHELDYLRLGCKHVVKVPCQSYGSLSFSKTCEPELNQGKSILSICEKDNLITDIDLFSRPTRKIQESEHLKMRFSEIEKELGRYSVFSSACKIRSENFDINHRNYFNNRTGSFDKLFRAATEMGCSEWNVQQTSED